MEKYEKSFRHGLKHWIGVVGVMMFVLSINFPICVELISRVIAKIVTVLEYWNILLWSKDVSIQIALSRLGVILRLRYKNEKLMFKF